jgi:ABC-2 type transport system permease protein
MALRHALRAFPALLRIGLAEAVAYRAEFIVWMLSNTLPLVNLALWSTVAREAPGGQFGRFGQSDFVAYFLATLIVRNLTGSWVTWEINQEIRSGTLSMRLLRPVHPFVAYAAEHLAAIPLRGLVVLPVAIVMLISVGGGHLVHDPVQILLLVPALLGAWALIFVSQLVLGTLGLFIQQSTSVFEVWLGLWAVLSGYLVPLELLPHWLIRVSAWLPFRSMLATPVEIMTGLTTRQQALVGVAEQWGWLIGFVLLARVMWRRGLRRHEAVGS